MAEENQSKSTGSKRLYLSRHNKQLAGVCGGIADYFQADASLVRLGWIILTIVTGILPGILAYVIAAIVIPKAPSDTPHSDIAGE